MNVLIGCERSGVVRDAFIRHGHNAISCDLQETIAPGPHYQGDLFDFINQFPKGYFDLFICHPPCTYLAVTANKWLKDQAARKSGALVGQERRDAQEEAIAFFMKCAAVDIARKCLENPVGIMSTIYRQPDQIIQPYLFGHPEPKKTCLWLHNLPLLNPTKKAKPEYHITESGKRVPKWFFFADKSKGDFERQNIRSQTFPGIADAMAYQWGSGFGTLFDLFITPDN